jgi:hypothetical protein
MDKISQDEQHQKKKSLITRVWVFARLKVNQYEKK